MFSNRGIMTSTKNCLDKSDKIEQLRTELQTADAILIGAGAGLSTSAGFTYTGKRFEKYFFDFIKKYDFRDMYSGGFYPFERLEEYWAYWSRYIYINRYANTSNRTYQILFELVKDKDYFVLTTNVDHQFQKVGFDKNRLFYTQGDYGLFQCSRPCHAMTYDNKEIVYKMIQSQGYVFTEEGMLYMPENIKLKMEIQTKLIPHCPVCGRPMSMNLRADDTFVEDHGWKRAAERYSNFIQKHQNMKVLFLELGVGMNTPGIIKYPFWQMTVKNRNTVYGCVNYGEAKCPAEIKEQAICIEEDIHRILEHLYKSMVLYNNRYGEKKKT